MLVTQERFDNNDFLDIPKPDDAALDAWREHLSACSGRPISREMMLQAYYMECFYVIGMNKEIEAKHVLRTLYQKEDGSFDHFLGSFTRDVLSEAISVLEVGLRTPRYGDTQAYHDLFDKRIGELTNDKATV